jgi:hypothetical protein
MADRAGAREVSEIEGASHAVGVSHPDEVADVVFAATLLNPEVSAGGWLTVLLTYFLGPGLVWAVVSLVDGTTELAIGAHFANNLGSILLINTAGSAVSAPALFTISEYHATYGALSVLVVIPVFLAISYKVFRRDGASEPVSKSHRKGSR